MCLSETLQYRTESAQNVSLSTNASVEEPSVHFDPVGPGVGVLGSFFWPEKDWSDSLRLPSSSTVLSYPSRITSFEGITCPLPFFSFSVGGRTMVTSQP